MGAKILPFRRAPAAAAPAPALSDEAVLAACATGDTAALGELFERFHVAVYRTLSRYVGAVCPELDDLVQATFLELLAAAPKFRRQSTVRTFILGVAVNVARHHRRSESRRMQLLSGAARQPQPSVQGPDQGAARGELRQRLAQAIEALPHDLRVAFVLCDLEEIAGAEVARALAIPEGTLWRRLFQARRALRRALAEEEP